MTKIREKYVILNFLINKTIISVLSFQEKLRMKIIERLTKEGSNADEPTNIPLSDYTRYRKKNKGKKSKHPTSAP